MLDLSSAAQVDDVDSEVDAPGARDKRQGRTVMPVGGVMMRRGKQLLVVMQT
jgi:hypothetical protein